MEKAVIDRIEESWAVLLVGESGRVVNAPRSSLPRRAREGQWLLVELEGDEVISAVVDREETERARKRIEGKLERLRRGEHQK
ncbi:MAG TPA: DUF3006 domain-containing protein [Chloroflexia bacterium]|jgi:hypothetical protein